MAITTNSIGYQRDQKLFYDKKFFVLQAIPNRSNIKQLITEGGGVIVTVEKQADLIIADHDNKLGPPGSISWTYIRESVQKGHLQDIKDHSLAPKSICEPELSTRQLNQSTRTHFTEEDDKFLYDHCIEAEKSGIKTNGNKLYQKLERINNRHTHQSWRNRWIRKGPFLKQKYSTETTCENNREDHHYMPDQSNIIENQQQAVLDPKSPSLNKSPTPNVNPKKKPRLKHFESTTKISQHQLFVSQEGDYFTQFETDLLSDAYVDIMRIDQNQIIDAWMAWAYEYPNHTAQEWRNYFEDYVKPMYEGSLPRAVESSSHLEAEEGSRSPADQISPSNLHVPARFLEDTHSNHSLESSKSRLTEICASQEDSDHTFSPVRYPDYRGSKFLDKESITKASRSISTESNIKFIEDSEICGRNVPPSEIWKANKLPEFGGFGKTNELNLWCPTADKLSFSSRDSTAADKLIYCHHETLTEFEKVRGRPIMDRLPSESQVEYSVQTQLSNGIEHQDENSSYKENETCSEGTDKCEGDKTLDPQSLQKSYGTSLKRRIIQGSKTRRDVEMKRQRVNNSKDILVEVPATPEEKKTTNSSDFLPGLKSSPTSQLPFESSISNENEIMGSTDKLVNYNQQLDFCASNSRFISPSECLDIDPESQYCPSLIESNQEYDTVSSFVSGNHSKNRITQKNEIADESPRAYSSPPLEVSFKISDTSDKRKSGMDDDISQYTCEDQKFLISNSKFWQNEDSSVRSRGHLGNNSIPCTIKNAPRDKSIERNRDLLEEFITDQVIGLGFPQDVIIEALEATSMRIGRESYIQQVMDSLLNGDGIPDNLSGVWTADDDRALKEQVRGKEYERIVKKHGKQKIKLRHQFWSDMEDADDRA